MKSVKPVRSAKMRSIHAADLAPAFLRAQCTDRGRDPGELRLAVALRDLHLRDVGALSDLGVDELVIVDAPPEDAWVATDWVHLALTSVLSRSGAPGAPRTRR